MKDLLTLDEIAELYEFSKYCTANNLKKNGIKPKNEKVGYLLYDAKEVDAVVRNIKHKKKAQVAEQTAVESFDMERRVLGGSALFYEPA